MTSSGACVVDMQCFIDNSKLYIVKELSILDMENLSSGHWLFKPPENLSLNAFSYRVNSWLTRNFHQIKWEEGEVDYVELDAILHKHLTHYNKIFVKGLQKKQFLNHYCGNVINLEEFDCPQISQLRPLNDGTQCLLHNKTPTMCTHFHVYALSHWILISNVLRKI